jgi:hypothetical protein
MSSKKHVGRLFLGALVLAALGAAPVPVPPASTSVAASRPVALASQPVEKDGLAVVIEPTKDTFTSGEALVIKVTYRNVSQQVLRLPDQPALYNFWYLRLEEVNTHKTYTGGTSLPMGAGGDAKASAAIAAGDTLATVVTFQRYGFVEGTLDVAAFDSAKFKLAQATRGPAGSYSYLPPLPPGTYKVRVDIRFPNKTAADGDPTPVWPGKAIESNPVEIKVTP